MGEQEGFQGLVVLIGIEFPDAYPVSVSDYEG
jgi:hypothetical protein